MKKIVTTFLSLAAALALTGVAQAENCATFNLLKAQQYYIDGREVWSEASFVQGTFGAFTSFESFPAKASYYCESDSGYHIAKWVLRTAGISGTKTIQEWTNASSITITFDYKWAAKYGTTLELIVYAEQLSYNLTYDPNGGTWVSGEPAGGTYQFLDNVTAPSDDVAENDNYVLSGWKCSGGTLIAPGETFDGEALNVTQADQAIVLYAQWEAAKYKVTLNLNGGKVSKNLTEYTYGVGATLPTATKSGSVFQGWYDNEMLMGSNVVTRISATDTGDKEFWAKFTTDISYNGNGATGGTMSDTPFVAGKQVQLTKNAFTRAYTVTFNATCNGGALAAGESDTAVATYTFKNWNNKANGSGAYTYSDNQKVTNPCGSTDGAVVLYAQWDDIPVNVRLPKVASLEGQEFLGWYTAQTGGIRVGGADDEYEPPRDIVLYAQWKDSAGKVSYKITYSPGADVTNPEAMKDVITYGEDVGVPVWLKKKGDCAYENLASSGPVGWIWNGVKYDLGSSFTLEEGCEGETIVMRAAWSDSCGEWSDAVGLDNAVLDGNGWEPQENTIRAKGTTTLSMKVRGAGVVTYDWSAEGAATISDESGKSQDISGTGSWEGQKTFSVTGDDLHEIQWVTTGEEDEAYRMRNVRWVPATTPKFTITTGVYPTGAGTVTAGGTYESGKEITLTATANANYEFLHWSDGSTDPTHTITVVCDETVTAVFKGDGQQKYYYVLFNGNGADNLAAMDGQQMTCGGAGNLVANKFSRDGFVFKGWGLTRNGSTVAYANKAAITKDLAGENETVTLYAVWDESASGSGSSGSSESGSDSSMVSEGVFQSCVGETVSFDFADCFSQEIKKVSGLPTGLKYGTKTGLVTGKPTKAVSKENNVTVTFTDKTTTKVTWTVTALPTMMVGTYYGRVEVADGSVGMFQFKVTAAGKGSGSFYAAGKKISVTATKLEAEGDGFAATLSYTYAKTKYTEDRLILTPVATVDGVEIWGAAIEESEVIYDLEARRDTIKECFGKVTAGTYDVLEKDEDGAYLKAKVTAAGVVKVSGKLAADTGKLISVTQSTHLVVDDDGNPFAYIAIYKTVTGSEPVEHCEDWGL